MKFIITEGTFRDSDGSTKGVGQTIELDDEMAKVHATRVQAAPQEEGADATAAAPAEKVQAPAHDDAAPAAGAGDTDAAHQ